MPIITVADYNPDYVLGKVISEGGLDATGLPDERSEIINNLSYEDRLEWRFQMTVGDDVWILLNEHIEIPYTTEVGEDGRINYITDGHRQYMTGTFVPLKRAGKELIEVIHQPPPTSVFNWGLPRG